MYQIDNSTAVATIPASTAAGTPGFFTDGNPATGVPATIMPAEYQNMLMMEVINVLAAAGITPSKSNFTQLLTAIKAVNRQGVILTDTGTAGAYAAANTPALTSLPVTGYTQRINIANLNPGAATYSPDGLTPKPIYGLGLQALQGGELPAGIAVLMYLVQAGVNGGNGAWIIIESLGGASQVAAATKSQHALTKGQADAAYATLASPAFSGNPTAPTPAVGDNDTSIATTAFVTAVQALLNTAIGAKAPLDSPALTGAPTAPTQAGTDSTTKLATTAQVQAAIIAAFSAKILGSIGYQKLPGGWIIQWGEVTVTAVSGSYQAFSFPLRFPGNCAVAIGGRKAQGSNAVMLVGQAGGDPAGQVLFQNFGTSTEVGQYIAIGY